MKITIFKNKKVSHQYRRKLKGILVNKKNQTRVKHDGETLDLNTKRKFCPQDNQGLAPNSNSTRTKSWNGPLK